MNDTMTYMCSAGETFDGIALDLYGDERYVYELLMANPEYCGTMVFVGGEELIVPVIEVPDEDSEMDEVSVVAPWKE